MIATKGYETPPRPCLETLWRTFCSPKEPFLCHSLGVVAVGPGFYLPSVQCDMFEGLSRKVHRAGDPTQGCDTPRGTIHQRQCIQRVCLNVQVQQYPSDSPLLHLLRKHTNRPPLQLLLKYLVKGGGESAA